MLFLVLAAALTLAQAGRLPYIVNGNNAQLGAYPWQVSWQQWNQHICGASLISSRWLVTAGHCVGNPPSDYSAVVGAYDIKSMRQGDPKRYYVQSITTHPQWQYDSSIQFPNDIALIHLQNDVDMSSPLVSTIALPDENEDFTGNPNCMITGWGSLSTIYGASPDILQELRVNILPTDECMQYVPNYGNWHICVNSQVGGACAGDSGGPLACQKNGVWKLVGDASFVFGDCDIRYPTVYGRMPYFVSWVRKTTGIY